MDIRQQFESIGGNFVSSTKEISIALKNTHCFFFDWDGVFNNGIKSNDKGSPFSEADSMGLNMLRFSYWLIHGKVPITAIITGANNITAVEFAKRENLHTVVLNSKNKKEVISKLAIDYGYSTNESLFVYDDILDLGAAKECKLSFCVRRNSSPLFNQFINEQGLANYITANEGGNHAIREVSELIIGLNGNYTETVSKRIEHTGDYERYLKERNTVIAEI